MKIRSLPLALAVAALVVMQSACSSGGDAASSPLTIAPDAPEVEPGATVQFSALVPGVEEPVAWHVVEPDGGTIDESGTYLAPEGEGTYTVTASLVSSSLTQATAVRVRRNVHVEVAPTAATIAAGETLALLATVTGPVKTVTWSVAEGPTGGSVTDAGVYTAPAAAGVYTVVATSTVDGTKTAAATVTVAAAPPPTQAVTIGVSPQAASIAAGGTVQFLASVTGSSDTGATWSVAEAGGGSVGATGVYTAPAVAGTYHVVATSTADGSKTANATVTVTAPPPPPPPVTSPGVGTGTTYKASYLTGVTGGGAMPSWTNAVTAACAGDGVTDDTSCLQAAANAARDQGRPLAIPSKASAYRITRPVTVYGSIGGVGGMPTIRQTSTDGSANGNGLVLARGMSGWVYNLRIVGTFTGSSWTGEWAHNIDVGNVNGVTIRGNVLENAMGDAIGTDASAWDGGSTSSNVIIDGNTMRNPRRCGVAFIKHQRSWVVMNNLIEKPVNYVSGIDFEPEGGTIVDVEVGYNKFVMNNRTPGTYGSDGRAISAWQNSWSPTPGGNFYLHHNYGTFGVGWWMPTSSYKGGMGDWYNVVQVKNVEGSAIPL